MATPRVGTDPARTSDRTAGRFRCPARHANRATTPRTLPDLPRRRGSRHDHRQAGEAPTSRTRPRRSVEVRGQRGLSAEHRRHEQGTAAQAHGRSSTSGRGGERVGAAIGLMNGHVLAPRSFSSVSVRRRVRSVANFKSSRFRWPRRQPVRSAVIRVVRASLGSVSTSGGSGAVATTVTGPEEQRVGMRQARCRTTPRLRREHTVPRGEPWLSRADRSS